MIAFERERSILALRRADTRDGTFTFSETMTQPGFGQLAQAIADKYRIERELGSGGMATVYHGQGQYRGPAAYHLPRAEG